ncbi:ABC transporter substrate-binding protein [Bosea sp. 2RAB26]|jgi:peptide/nickel transport system substrate-binding protein|uniref:ABC transporter substrate-binding protein n=1 Tax=Bosea sp. 2RAB26 TaxID=3237476 RepID=UPI003F92C647
MTMRTYHRALIGAALLAGTMMTPAIAQMKTITGGFDVGPGGLQGNFNPMTAPAGYTWLSTYFEPLVTYDAGLTKLVPALATSWEISDDKLSYTFKLAQETWHDGQAFTAEDVKFTIALNKNPKTASLLSARLAAIDSVEVKDPRTVVVRLSRPDNALIVSLTKMMILPAHALSAIAPEDMAKNVLWSTKPIGTGPFKFVRYETDRFVELAAHESYRGGKPKVDRLINRYFANAAAAISALRAGEIQFTYIESDDVPTFKGNKDFTVIEGASYVANYIGFNNQVPLWNDIRVRQAVMHAIDRNAIIDSLYKGAAKKADCGYVEGSLIPKGLDAYAYDPAKATQLLKEAGWDKINGTKPITWLTYYNNPLTANVMAAVQSMLAQVGINVVPRALDPAGYNAIAMSRTSNPADFPLVYAGLQNGPDPGTLNLGLNESQIPPVGQNFLQIKIPELNSALNAAVAETDQAKATTKYQDVCAVMNKTLPWGTMWVANRYGVASVKLKDFVWTPAPGGGPFAATPEKWSIAP